LSLNLVIEGIIFLTVVVWLGMITRFCWLSPNKGIWLIFLIGGFMFFSAATLNLVEDMIGHPGLAEDAKDFSFAVGAVLLAVGFYQWSSWTIRNMRRLENVAVKDELTRLFNRRGFLQRLAQEIERSRRRNYGFNLLILDLNNFKFINDTHGHPVGDTVLKKTASILESELRSYDILGRIGGDEFAAILPDTRPEDGFEVSERIIKAIERGSSGAAFQVSVAVGAAFFPLEADSAEKLIIVADRRMYKNKTARAAENC